MWWQSVGWLLKFIDEVIDKEKERKMERIVFSDEQTKNLNDQAAGDNYSCSNASEIAYLANWRGGLRLIQAIPFAASLSLTDLYHKSAS